MKKFTSILILIGTILIASIHTAFANTTVNIIAISDVHFDPFQACHTTPCPTIDKLETSPIEQWDKILSETPTSKGNDSNYHILKLLINELSYSAKKNHIGFVLMLGDFLGHHYKDKYLQYSSIKTEESYKAFALKTFRYLTVLVKKAMPDISVYSVVGNNDTYYQHNNLSDLHEFSEELGNVWSDLIYDPDTRDSFLNQFTKAGYYAIKPREMNNVLIVGLHSTIFSLHAKGKSIDQFANEQLDWLQETLSQAQKNQEKILILMHIPDFIAVSSSLEKKPYQTIKFWEHNYSKRFQALLKTYDNNIIGIIAGHVHNDWFHIVNHTPVISVPTGSPILNAPAYKIIIFSTISNQFKDYQTFILNKNNHWEMEYDFNQIYQPHCFQCRLIDGMNQVKKSGKLADAYIKYYQLNNPGVITPKNWIYYWCNIYHHSVTGYEACLSSK